MAWVSKQTCLGQRSCTRKPKMTSAFYRFAKKCKNKQPFNERTQYRGGSANANADQTNRLSSRKKQMVILRQRQVQTVQMDFLPVSMLHMSSAGANNCKSGAHRSF